MNKEFISYEQALALKELGFDESCLAFYDNNYGTDIYTEKNRLIHYHKDALRYVFNTPLYQQAFRWFREKHGLYVSINIHSDNMWSVIIKSMTNDSTHTSGHVVDLINKGYSTFKTYEGAESACLDKLIAFVRDKQ
jgi:hypothetical protein